MALKKISPITETITPSFVYGVIIGASMILFLLMRLTDFDFAFDKGQIHAYTLFWLCGILVYLFYQSGKTGFITIKRVVLSGLSLIVIWELHDLFWCFSTLYITYAFTLNGAVLNLPVLLARASILSIAVILIIRKQINWGLKFALSLSTQLTYWILATRVPVITTFPICLVFDSLPALFMIKPLVRKKVLV